MKVSITKSHYNYICENIYILIYAYRHLKYNLHIKCDKSIKSIKSILKVIIITLPTDFMQHITYCLCVSEVMNHIYL